VAPSTGDPVAFAARISARSRVASAAIRYRTGGAAEWSEAPLADDGRPPDIRAGDGIWSGEVPALPVGNVEIYMTAKDSEGVEGAWPEGAPGRTALYAVGLIPSARFPTYTVLMSNAERQALAARPLLSNRLAGATLVYGDSRIFHEVGIRPRGSPFTRRGNGQNWRIVFGAETLDGRGTLTVDGQGGDGTRISERLTHWSAGELHAPNIRQQYVYFRIPGEEEGIYEDVEKVDRSFLAGWFEPEEENVGADAEPAAKRKAPASGEAERGGNLHKVDDYFELPADGQNRYDEARLLIKSADPEDYRWNFPPRANGPTEDFAPLIKLIQLFDARATPDKAFFERVEKAIDVDEWLRVLAARTLASDWDTLGLERGKNCMLYLTPSDGRWRLVPWDCDLSWQLNRTREPLFSNKFTEIRRLLDHPPYRRRFLGYLAYLAERRLEPAALDAVLEDLRAYSGARVDPWRDFARERRAFILGQIPEVPFQLADAKRVERSKEPDSLRVSGAAPIVAMRFRLLGPGGAGEGRGLRRSEGSVRFIDEARWVAEIPIGPEGGDAILQALDFGGNEVANAPVKVRARRGAMPLPEEPAAPAAVIVTGKGKDRDGSGEPVEPPSGAAVATAVLDAPPEAATADALAPSAAAAAAPAPVAVAVAVAGAGAEPRPSPAAGKTRPRRGKGLLDEEAAVLDALEEEERRRREDAASAAEVVERSSPSGSEAEESRTPLAPAAPEAIAEPGHAAAAAPPPAVDRGGIPWRLLVPLAVLLGGVQATLIFISRRRRAARAEAPGRAADPAAQTEILPRRLTARDATVAALAALGSRRYEEAAKALRRLSQGADVEALLEALGDPRPTPFQKIRRAADGSLTAVSSQTGAGIGIRHVAALLLGDALGKPPVPKPARADWEALWKASRGEVKPARKGPPRARGAAGTPPGPGPT
jgi:hypothetical protein